MVVVVACSRMYFFPTELTGIWTKTEPWEKEARKPDRTAERSAGGNGKMCHYGMDNTIARAIVMNCILSSFICESSDYRLY